MAKADNLIGTFSIRLKSTQFKSKVKNGIFDYRHLENMLVILQNQATPTQEEKQTNPDAAWQWFNLLTNPVVMKAVLSGNSGGEKTAEQIARVNEQYKDNGLFAAMVEHAKKLNDKNCSMIVRRTKGQWKTFFSQVDEWSKNLSAFTLKYGSPDKPEPPKAKKLSRISNASLPLESSKFSIRQIKKKDHLCVTLRKKQIQIPLKHKGMITSVGVKNITSARLCYSNDSVYIDFTYRKVAVNPSTTDNKPVVKSNKKAVKQAGLDVGLNNLLSLFVNDKTTSSLIISGRRFKSRNAAFNRMNAKLNQAIADEVTEWKEITRKDGSVTKYPIKHSDRGERLKRLKTYLIEKRNRYFDSEFNKVSKHLVDYLVEHKITDLVLSKNLSFAKTEGDIQLGKKTKQTFMQIPFGKLLTQIESKCGLNDINTHTVDEAWSSKTSCISSNINHVQEKATKGRQSIKTTDLNGSRVNRGLYKDKVIDKVFNADLNGAANHIKLAFKRVNLGWLKDVLFKLCNPVLIKSNNDFKRLIAA
ncbi:transposase [Vibrio parahaemolyticus]